MRASKWQWLPILVFFIIGFSFSKLYAQPNFIEGQYYIIEFLRAEKVVDVAEGSMTAGGRIHLWDRHNGDNQLFRFEDKGNGVFTIIAKSSNMALEAPMERGTSRTPIIQNYDINSAAQKFHIREAPVSGYYYIVSFATRHGMFGDGTQNGALLKTTRNADQREQMFRFVPYGAPIPPAPTPIQDVEPGIPTLNAPITGLIMQHGPDVVWNFDWSDVPNADGYQILIEHKNQTDRLVNEITNSSNFTYTFNAPIAGHLSKDAWGWWVRARNGSTWGKWSQPNTIFLEQKTSGPSLFTPAPNAVLNNGNPTNSTQYAWTFDWQDVPGAQTYHLVVNNPQQNGFINYHVQESQYVHTMMQAIPSNNLNGWSWQVNASVNGVLTDWSELRYFNIEQAMATVPIPRTISPVPNAQLLNGTYDGFRGLNWAFHWEAISGASQYELQIGYTDGGVYKTITAYSNSYIYDDPELIIKPEFINGWLWKVRANVNGTWSDWSSPSLFSVTYPEEEAKNISNFNNGFYRLRGGFINAYLGNQDECSYGRDIVCYGTKLVVQYDDNEYLEFQLEGASKTEEVYALKAYIEGNYSNRRELGYLSHNLSFGGDPYYDHWIIEEHPTGYFYIRMKNSDQVLQIMDVDSYNDRLHMKLNYKSGHQRQSFNIEQN